MGHKIYTEILKALEPVLLRAAYRCRLNRCIRTVVVRHTEDKVLGMPENNPSYTNIWTKRILCKQ